MIGRRRYAIFALTCLLALTAQLCQVPISRAAPPVVVTVDTPDGPMLAEVVRTDPNHAQIKVKNYKTYWLNITVQQTSGQVRLTPANLTSTIYAKIGLLPPNEEIVWEAEFDQDPPEAVTVIGTSNTRGPGGKPYANAMTVLEILFAMLGADPRSSFAHLDQAIEALDIALQIPEFAEACDELTMNPREFAVTLFKLANRKEVRDRLYPALLKIASQAVVDALEKFLPVVSTLFTLYDLALISADIGVSLVSGTFSTTATFSVLPTARSTPTPVRPTPTPISTPTTNYGCALPVGTGDPVDGSIAPAVQEQFRKGYCDYKNGANGKPRFDLSTPQGKVQRGSASAVTGAKTIYQIFSGGVLQYHETGPRAGSMILIWGAIRTHWEQQGAGTSVLGLPVADEEGVTSGASGKTGRIQVFEAGAITFYEGKAFTTWGAIDKEYYQVNGSVPGRLGFPTRQEEGAKSGATGVAGRIQVFENGAIVFYNSRTFTVWGAIDKEYYQVNGSVPGRLGFPTRQEEGVRSGADGSGKSGRIQVFEAGAITFYEGKTFTTWGAVDKEYFQVNGSVPGRLGFPTRQEEGVVSGASGKAGRIQVFEAGAIVFYDGKTFTVWGAVDKEYYQVNGSVPGRLGFPTRQEEGVNSGASGKAGRIQVFENGAIVFYDGKRFTTWGKIDDKYYELGSVPGRLGYAASQEEPASYGSQQRFEGGSLAFCRAQNVVVVVQPNTNPCASR